MRNIKNKDTYQEMVEVAIKSVLFALCAGILTTLIHMLSDMYIFHSHGKPETATIALIVYTSFDKALIAVGYYVLGRKIPVKNAILRSMIYVGLNWMSNYLPQIMGLAFADGAIAEKAFSISILACDTIVYIVLSVILGALFREDSLTNLRSCDGHTYGKTVAISAILFPALVVIADRFMSFVFPAFSSSYVIQVSEQARIPFLINFYCWFFLTGAFIAVFYRMTEYNDEGSWLKFALKYSLLLWTPVIMIMVLFGTAFIPTTVFALIFLVIIMLISWINSKMMVTVQNHVLHSHK